MKKKQLLLGLAGGGLLVVGVLAGMIFGDNLRALAASNTPAAQATQGNRASYCQVYMQRLASDLGVTVDKLKSANQDAAQTVINQLANDGKISAAEKSKLTQALQRYVSSPCAFVDLHGAKSGMGAGLARVLLPARAAIESAVASSLKISTATLQSDLTAGQTIPQIAAAQKVNLSDVNTAYLNAVKAQLSSGVQANTITQAQSDEIYAKIQQMVQQKFYPLLTGGAHKGTKPTLPTLPTQPGK